jgi:hypothetical protein
MIVLSTSSGGTQAGIIAGCRLPGCRPGAWNQRRRWRPCSHGSLRIRRPRKLIGAGAERRRRDDRIDDRFAGGGYGTDAAVNGRIELCARREALFLDPTYTSRRWPGSSQGSGRATSAPGRPLAPRRTSGCSPELRVRRSTSYATVRASCATVRRYSSPRGRGPSPGPAKDARKLIGLDGCGSRAPRPSG